MRAKELMDEACDSDKVSLPAQGALQDILLTQHIYQPGVFRWTKILERAINQWFDELLEHAEWVQPGTVLYESVESHLIDAVLRLEAEVEAGEQIDDQCFIFRFDGVLTAAARHANMNIENFHH